jgi:hypothetical protein
MPKTNKQINDEIAEFLRLKNEELVRKTKELFDFIKEYKPVRKRNLIKFEKAMKKFFAP